mgnify:CR=1 FL=1
MKKNVIISLADAKYFELLEELVDSIKRFKESENTAICILDAGLTDEQKKHLSMELRGEYGLILPTLTFYLWILRRNIPGRQIEEM